MRWMTTVMATKTKKNKNKVVKQLTTKNSAQINTFFYISNFLHGGMV